MLAGPPAEAMMYVKQSMGLEPSVYGGGGSPSSTPLPEDSPLVSLVSAQAFDSASSSARASSKEGAGAVARSESHAVPVTAALMRSSSASEGK